MVKALRCREAVKGPARPFIGAVLHTSFRTSAVLSHIDENTRCFRNLAIAPGTEPLGGVSPSLMLYIWGDPTGDLIRRETRLIILLSSSSLLLLFRLIKLLSSSSSLRSSAILITEKARQRFHVFTCRIWVNVSRLSPPAIDRPTKEP